MIQRREITADILDSFVRKSHFVHYMKTSSWAKFKEETEGLKHVFLGFYDNEELIGTAMVLLGSFFGHRYCYVPKGPCLDYNNPALLEEVMKSLIEFAGDTGVQFLRIDPDVIRVSRDILGNQIDGINNESITESLKEIGFHHKGYGYAYDGSWTNRYTLITDLSPSMEEVIKTFSKPRRTSLNRHKISGVFTRLGSEDDLPSLMKFEAMLGEIDGFPPHPLSFFRSLLSCFGDHARLYVTEISLEAMITGIQAELDSRKYRKDPEAREAKEKDLAHAQELLNKYGDKLAIACGLFLYEGDMSWDLYTYNHKEFNFIKPVDNLHVFAMNDMKSLGVLRYDLCGFSGVTSKEDSEYGLYSYKRSFGPEFIEQIGEFDYVYKEKAYRRFKKVKSLEVRARHKYWRLRYRKNQNS